MSPMGLISQKPNQNFRRLIFVQGFSAIVSVALVFWWGSLIARLDSSMRPMIFWEGGTFVALIVATFILFLILFNREERRARSVQSFFASMTHELRTPLTSIRLQAESLADQFDTPLIQRLTDDTHRLEAQLERSLELARIEGGGSVHLQRIPLHSFFSRLKDQVGAFGKDRVDLRVDDCVGYVVLADSNSLYTVFRNLLENSVRHSGQKTVKVEITFRRVSNQIEVKVHDSGKGFQGDRRKAGHLFYKGPESHGAGVGLYLVRALIARMGGRCEFGLDSPGFTAQIFLNSEDASSV